MFDLTDPHARARIAVLRAERVHVPAERACALLLARTAVAAAGGCADLDCRLDALEAELRRELGVGR